MSAVAVSYAGELPRGRSVAFTVHGQPVPWKRAGRAGKRTFTPTRVSNYQNAIAWIAKIETRSNMWPLDALYRVELAIYTENARKIDSDNVLKQLGDACQGRKGAPGILWNDDSQIIETATIKRIDRDNPRIDVRVYVLETREPTP